MPAAFLKDHAAHRAFLLTLRRKFAFADSRRLYRGHRTLNAAVFLQTVARGKFRAALGQVVIFVFPYRFSSVSVVTPMFY
jgi:hypothetical protein